MVARELIPNDLSLKRTKTLDFCDVRSVWVFKTWPSWKSTGADVHRAPWKTQTPNYTFFGFCFWGIYTSSSDRQSSSITTIQKQYVPTKTYRHETTTKPLADKRNPSLHVQGILSASKPSPACSNNWSRVLNGEWLLALFKIKCTIQLHVGYQIHKSHAYRSLSKPLTPWKRGAPPYNLRIFNFVNRRSRTLSCGV